MHNLLYVLWLFRMGINFADHERRNFMKGIHMKKCVAVMVLLSMFFSCNPWAFADDEVPVPTPERSPEPLYTWDGGVEIIPPHKTIYYEGEMLNLTGLEAYGTSGIRYDNGKNEITYRKALTDMEVDLEGKPLTVVNKYVTVSGCYPITGTIRIWNTFEITVLPFYDFNVTITDNSLLRQGDSVSGTVGYNVINRGEISKDVSTILTIYDSNGKMVFIAMNTANLKSGENKEAFTNINIPVTSSGTYTVKIFCWNGLDKIEPLSVAAMVDMEL